MGPFRLDLYRRLGLLVVIQPTVSRRQHYVAARFLSEWEQQDNLIDIHFFADGLAIPPAVHAAVLERRLFASLKLSGACPTWKDIVVDPSTTGRLADTIHGALEVYDLPDLVSAFRRARKD